jgi:hypothetical protein
MEPETSYSQEPAPCPSRELDESGAPLGFGLILSCNLIVVTDFPSGPFLSGFPVETQHAFFLLPSDRIAVTLAVHKLIVRFFFPLSTFNKWSPLTWHSYAEERLLATRLSERQR